MKEDGQIKENELREKHNKIYINKVNNVKKENMHKNRTILKKLRLETIK